MRGGFLGVDVFFVLSGYLLTSLLLAEHDRAGRIDFRAYAGRRLRRVGPALLVVLVALLLLAPVLATDDAHRLRGDFLWSVTGLTNWHLVADGASYFSHLGRPPFVRHLWSVAVELQFYVVCPFIVAFIARRRPSVAVAALMAGIALSATAMAAQYVEADPSRVYYGTDTRVGALLVGALAAVLPRLTVWWPRVPRWSPALGPGALVVIGLVILVADESSRAMYPAGFLAVEVAAGVAIAAVVRGGRTAGLVGSGGLSWLGRRSYGIYLWHWPLVVLTHPGLDTWWFRPAAAAGTIAGAVVLGSLSYALVERPLQRPWSSRPPALAAARRNRYLLAGTLAVAVVATLFGRLPTADPLGDSLLAGQRALAAQAEVVPSESPSPAPSPAAQAPPPAAPVQRPLVAQPPPVRVPVTAIGDSVMLGAAPALKARLGGEGYIDAGVSRQFSAGIAVAHTLREQNRLGRVAVVHLGNNGKVTGYDIDLMMQELTPVETVLFVTVRVDEPWREMSTEALVSATGRHPKLKIVDWHDYSRDRPEWFGSDGTHLGPTGAGAYADLVASAIPPPPAPPPPPPPPPIAGAASKPAPAIAGAVTHVHSVDRPALRLTPGSRLQPARRASTPSPRRRCWGGAPGWYRAVACGAGTRPPAARSVGSASRCSAAPGSRSR